MEGYGLVYQKVMRDSLLTPEARMIYAYLCCFAGSGCSCYPGLELMLKECRMSKTRFYKHLQVLVDTGIVSKRQERDGQRLGRTVYKLNHGKSVQFPCFEETERNELPSSEVPNSVIPCFDESQSRLHNSNSLNSNTIMKNNTEKNIYVRVCDLLNQAKAQASSKGRLKPNNYIVDQLREFGMPDAAIIQAAQDLADRGRDVDWFSLRDHCEAKGLIPRIDRKRR